MNLAALVAKGFAAIPAGVKGTCRVYTVARGTQSLVTGKREGDLTSTQIGVPCVVETPTPDTPVPPGLDPAKARKVTIPAAALNAAPQIDLTLLAVDGAGWSDVAGAAPKVRHVETVAPDAATPLLYVCWVVLP